MQFSVKNLEIYGLKESIIASSYPKNVELENNNLKKALTINDIKRARMLGKVPGSTGHDCYLKGIIVQCDLTASHAFWIQWQRHHFQDIISSQSKMHKITSMDIDKQCNEYVSSGTIETCERYKKHYINEPTRENFFKLIYNLPLGLMLTARITDNYLSLKTQYHQRKNEKLDEWVDYCKIIKEFPMFKELVLGE